MNKRGLGETSPEHPQSEKRYSCLANTSIVDNNMTQSGIIVEEVMKRLLKENNDELYKNLATKFDLQCLHEDLASLKVHHEELTQRVIQLESQNTFLEAQIDRIMQKSTETNLVVRLQKNHPEACENAKAICAGLLNEPNAEALVDSAYSVRTRNSQSAMIIVKMKSRESAFNVLKKAGTLKGKDISIQKDLPRNVRQRRAKLLRIRKVLLERAPHAKIAVRDDKMVIQDRTFTWDSSLGLKCGEYDGLNILKSIFGDISFLNLLMNDLLKQNNVYQMSNIPKNNEAVKNFEPSVRQNVKVGTQNRSLTSNASTSSGCVHEA